MKVFRSQKQFNRLVKRRLNGMVVRFTDGLSYEACIYASGKCLYCTRFDGYSLSGTSMFLSLSGNTVGSFDTSSGPIIDLSDAFKDDRLMEVPDDMMLVKVSVPWGIPGLTSRTYNLDDRTDTEELRAVDLWEILIELEPGQRITFECIKRVDEGKELGPDGEYVTYSNQKPENHGKTLQNVTMGEDEE